MLLVWLFRPYAFTLRKSSVGKLVILALANCAQCDYHSQFKNPREVAGTSLMPSLSVEFRLWNIDRFQTCSVLFFHFYGSDTSCRGVTYEAHQ
jgi:hypothetical protein